MAVMDFGRMAIFLDPVGAAFAVWQAGTMEGADVVGEFGALGWFELLTRDVEASKTFYTTILGLTPRDVEFGPSTYTLWEQDGASVAGMMPMEGDQWPAEVPPHWMIYFAVEDCDGAARRAGELGGTVPVPPMDTPAGRMAVISDPHGAAFSIIVPNPDFQP
jgi:predicted enzyme related to lactoylglutathione lyase